MKLISYKDYCNEVFLTEEKTKDVIKRLKDAFPDEAEFAVYNSILDLFPSTAAKSIITTALIRTREERKRQNVSPQDTKEVFEQLLELIKRNIRIDLADMMKKDREKSPDDSGSTLFGDLTQLVHYQTSRIAALAAKKLQKKAGVGGMEVQESKFPDPVYMDDNIEIYHADSPAKTSMYAGSSPGCGICVQQVGYFWQYRFNYENTYYYVFPKKPRNYKFIQVEIGKRLVWTDERNSERPFHSLEELKQLFPEMAPAIDQGVFKSKPFGKTEREDYQKIQNKLEDNSFKALNYEVRSMYIANGHRLTDGQWNMIDRNQKNDYINLSIHRDITDYQFEDVKNDPALYKRYVLIKRRGLENKIKTGAFLRDGASKHEAAILPQIMSGADEKAKVTIIQGLIGNMKNILTGKIEPKNDISGTYELFKGQLLADPTLQQDEVIKSIAFILAGGKSQSWERIRPEVKRGVYKVAEDIYNANSAKMKSFIDEMVKSDPSLLLKGLTTEPTPFQVQYFLENEQALLSHADFKKNLWQSLESHLVYGTILPRWLREYWDNNRKEKFFKDDEFMKKIRYDFQHLIFGKMAERFPKYPQLPQETKELYDMFIKDLREDKQTLMVVEATMYDLVMYKTANVDNVTAWPVSDDFKKYFKEHEAELKEWLAYKLIDTPPEHVRPELINLVNKYKEKVYADPTYKNEIEKRLTGDIIFNAGIVFHWSGERLSYWTEHFWDILKRFPKAEETLVQRMKKEFGTDRSANAFYSEYGIPFDFYQKHKAEILSDPEAYRGLKQKIIDALRWRSDKNATRDQSAQVDLSPIEKDFYNEHKNDKETDKTSENWEAWYGKPIFDEKRVSVDMRGQD